MSGMTKPQIELKSASTTRTVELSVAGVEPMRKMYGTWIFRPDLLTIIYRDGEVDEVILSGPRVLKDGVGGQRGSYSWYGRTVEDAPEWVRDTVATCTPVADK